MRVQTFDEMLVEYQPNGLDTDDIEERKKLLSDFPFSVIVEGCFLEFDTLKRWRDLNISEIPAQQIWYGKTGYDFGFTEFFFANANESFKLIEGIPNIYTSYPVGSIFKSVGYDEFIAYDPSDGNAIVYED